MIVATNEQFKIKIQLPGRETNLVLKISGPSAETLTHTGGGKFESSNLSHATAGNRQYLVSVFEANGTTPSALYGDYYYEVDVTSSSAGGGASLAEIEASTVLAKHADVDALGSPMQAGSAVTLAANQDVRNVTGTLPNVTVATNNDKTGYSGVATNMVASAPSAAANATAVRSELTTELGRIDAAMSSRLATAGYTAPTNPTDYAKDATVAKAATVGSPMQAGSAVTLAPNQDVRNVTGSVTGSVGSVTSDVGITQQAADKVWATSVRSLSTFGTLVSDIATAVWGSATRTLSAFGFTVPATIADKTGYSLSPAERTAIANEVEAQIIDDTDSEKILTAITDKIASVNPSLDELTLSSIATAVFDKLTDMGIIEVDGISNRFTANALELAPVPTDYAKPGDVNVTVPTPTFSGTVNASPVTVNPTLTTEEHDKLMSIDGGSGSGQSADPEAIASSIISKFKLNESMSPGSGVGSKVFVDRLTGAKNAPVVGAIVRAYPYTTDTTIDFSDLKGSCKTDAKGDYYLNLDPGKYARRIWRNGTVILDDSITVEP
jgi:hypothetical protein